MSWTLYTAPGHCHTQSLSSAVAPNTGRADRHIIIPERVGSPTIRLPAKVDCRDLWYVRASRPLGSIGISNARSNRETGNGVAVQPRLNGSVGANVVLEALPGPSGQRLRRGNPLGRKIRERGVVGLAVIHQN